MKRAVLHVSLVLLLLLPFSSLFALPAAAATGPGDLDTTFGTGGKVTTDFGGSPVGFSVAIQSDGKIVVAGYSNVGGTFGFALARYNTNGSLDATFGTGGKVTTNYGGDDRGYSLAIQSDGKIVVAGYSNAGGTFDFALARYNTNGSLDTSFSAGGKVTTDFGGSDDLGRSVALQGDGKIVVAGDSNVGSTFDFALARYNTNGSLDTSFGAGGKVTTDFGGSGDGGRSVALQGDGKIVVAGNAAVGGTADFALARYLAAAPAPTPTPTPVPGVGWPGLLALAFGLAALGFFALRRAARAHKAH